jgi:replicative DNA helicase
MNDTATKEEAVLRKAPSNLQAEQLLLGAILINNDVLSKINDFLLDEHFYEPVHARIYNAINTIIDKGVSASPVSLKNVFDRDESLQVVGGAEYLSKLVMMATTVVNAAEYARMVYNLALRRKLIAIGEDVVNDAFENEIELSAIEQIEVAEAKLYQLSQTGENDRGFVTLANAIDESIKKIDRAIKNKSAVSGITTGLIDLDKKLSGFQNSDLVIIAGRPSMGKTAVAINFAFNAAYALYEVSKKENIPMQSVGFFSLEMPAEQLSTRLLAMKAEVESSLLMSGKLTDNDYNKLRIQGEILAQMPFFIDDTPALTIAAVRARARRMKRKNNLGILFVDYLQLLRGTDASMGRVLEIGEITQGLKAIAKELSIPVIALSQLSRAVEQREDKKPLLSDLRESGSIEQDADIVMFLYREEYYLMRQQPEPGSAKYEEWLKRSETARGKLEVLIAKHRNGPIGEVDLFYNTAISKIGNVAG